MNNIKLNLLVILLFLLPLTIFAQTNLVLDSAFTHQTGFTTTLKNDGYTFVDVGIDFFRSPSNFRTEDYVLCGLILSGTALSFSLDNSVRKAALRNQNHLMNKVVPYGEKFGNPKYSGVLGGILYLGGHIVGDDYLRETGLILAETMILNGIVTQGLKILLGRGRPFLNEGNYEIDFLEMELNDENYSMPSGHTSTAFTVATVLSERINNTYASIVLYSLAGLTAYQRIYNDKHWISDTIFGAAIGTLTALKVVNLHSKIKGEKSRDINISLIPSYNQSTLGIGLLLSF